MRVQTDRRIGPPDPENYRHLERAVADYFEACGFRVFKTGQQDLDFRLGRWSPDFWVSAGFWSDAKLRNREYANFLIEDAELRRHEQDFPGTVYVLVADRPVELCGWITVKDAVKFQSELRGTHGGSGSGDPYRLIPSWCLTPMEQLIEALR